MISSSPIFFSLCLNELRDAVHDAAGGLPDALREDIAASDLFINNGGDHGYPQQLRVYAILGKEALRKHGGLDAVLRALSEAKFAPMAITVRQFTEPSKVPCPW